MFTESTIEYQFEREKRRVCAYDREKLVGVCLVEDAGVFWAIRHINVAPSYDPLEINIHAISSVQKAGCHILRQPFFK